MNRTACLARSFLVVCVVFSLTSCGKDNEDSFSGPTQLVPSAAATSDAPSSPSAPLSVQVTWQVATAASVVAGNNQQSYVFTARVTGGTAPYSYRWRFGDGTPPVEGNPATHKFYRPGTYAVFVVVRDATGTMVRSNAGGDLEIEISASPFSVACYVGPNEGEAPLQVELRAEPTGNVGPIQWSWDLGDGATSSQRIVSHAYDPLGSGGKARFTATATATDGLGRSVQCSQGIVVSIPDRCFREWVSGCVSQGVTAIAIGSDGCRESTTPPTLTPLPANLAAACIDNQSSVTRTVTFSWAGGASESIPVSAGTHQCVLELCPSLGASADGPLTLSW